MPNTVAAADASSCLSVVRFNSTIPSSAVSLLVTAASDLPMRTIKFCSVIFGVTSSLAVINNIHRRVELRRPSPAINKLHR